MPQEHNEAAGCSSFVGEKNSEGLVIIIPGASVVVGRYLLALA